MAQANYSGIPNDALIENGPFSTNRGIPLGQRATDGIRSFRWGHVGASVYRVGHVVVKRLSGILGAKRANSGFFRSCTYNAGFGGANAEGSVDIYLYSAVHLSNQNKYAGGDIMMASSTGQGHSYPIHSYELGAAGKRTLLKIRRPLAAAIGTGTNAVFLENQYYNLQLPIKDVIEYKGWPDAKVMGAITASDGKISNTSGFQWLQTGGPGTGYVCGVISHMGDYLGVVSGGRLSNPDIFDSTVWTKTSSLKIFAQATHAGTSASRYMLVDWLIETPL